MTAGTLQFEKCLYHSENGHIYLSVHARILGTSLYAIAHRDALDTPVRLLDAINDEDWDDPILQEMRQEATTDLLRQVWMVQKAVIGISVPDKEIQAEVA